MKQVLNKPFRFVLILLTLIALVLLLSRNSSAAPKTMSGKVVSVINGSTLEILTSENEILLIKLKSVEAPEIDQEFGMEAKKYAIKFCLKKKVEVEIVGKDRKGNRLAIVKLQNGKMLNEHLVKMGLGWINSSGEQQQALVEKLEIAKATNTGLWQSDEPVAPWIYRRTQSMMRPKGL